MAKRVLAGSKVTNPTLGTQYWQHRMGATFDDIGCERNYVYTSVHEAFTAAMKKALNNCRSNTVTFLPVIMGVVNKMEVGHLGMIRHVDNYFEFSYFETGNRDYEVSRSNKMLWETQAIRNVNEKTLNDEHYPYYHNITQVEYIRGMDNDSADLFNKAVLTFVNAFSRREINSLPTNA